MFISLGRRVVLVIQRRAVGTEHVIMESVFQKNIRTTIGFLTVLPLHESVPQVKNVGCVSNDGDF
jgi:hypothetical protein